MNHRMNTIIDTIVNCLMYVLLILGICEFYKMHYVIQKPLECPNLSNGRHLTEFLQFIKKRVIRTLCTCTCMNKNPREINQKTGKTIINL